MPGSSSSRAISSEGHLEALDNFNFSVYIRDSDNEEVEKYTNVAPGTKLTISALRAGNYKVAIRGNEQTAEIGTLVQMYGSADAVVQGGVENTVDIKLKEVNHDGRINFFIETLDSSSKARTEITCKNGDSYSTGIETLSEESGDSGSVYYYQLDNLFFEPGFTYTATIYIYGIDGELGGVYETYKTSATATNDGIVFTVN